MAEMRALMLNYKCTLSGLTKNRTGNISTEAHVHVILNLPLLSPHIRFALSCNTWVELAQLSSQNEWAFTLCMHILTAFVTDFSRLFNLTQDKNTHKFEWPLSQSDSVYLIMIPPEQLLKS